MRKGEVCKDMLASNALLMLMALGGLVGEVLGDVGIGFLSMAFVTSVACIGAAYAVAATGTGAIASTTEKPEIFARALIFVGLAEGIAIYGLIVALLIWINLPSLAA